MKEHIGPIDERGVHYTCPDLAFPLCKDLVKKIGQVNTTGLRRSVIWFRNDLRTIDHAPLIDACLYSNSPECPEDGSSCVIGVYIYNTFDFNSHDWGAPKLSFLHRALGSLSDSLWKLYRIPLLVIQINDPELCYSFFSQSSTEAYSSQLKKIKLEQNSSASLRRSKFADQFYNFCKALGISSIYCHSEICPDEILRDQAIISRFSHQDNDFKISCHFDYNDQSLLPFGSIFSKSTNEPYKVFTPFRTLWATRLLSFAKAFESASKGGCKPSQTILLPWAKLDGEIPSNPSDSQVVQALRDSSIESLRVLCKQNQVDSPDLSRWPESEEACILKISSWFSQHLPSYKVQRDFPSNEDGTSKISPYLALGIISVRTLIRILFEAPKCTPSALLAGLSSKNITGECSGPMTYLSELCWREFYRNILFSFPKVSFHLM